MKIKSLHKVEIGQRLKVAAYARISSNKDTLETSLEEQIDYYTGIIIQNPNWEFAGIYYDDGISGTTIEHRKGFIAMIENARAGLIDIILVKSISRFGRNITDLLSVLRELRNKGVEIYFERQNISSLDEKSNMMITTYAGFAEEEAVSVSENVKWRVEKNMRDGIYHLPTSQMMGYRYNEQGEIVIFEPEAKTIQLIYKFYLDGYGCAQIAEYLTNTKAINRYGQCKWERSTIRNILRNEKYAGDFLFKKTYIESPLTHKKIVNHGQIEQYIVENGHPAIINRDDWNKVQEIMNNNARKFNVPNYDNGTYKPDKKTSPLKGFIVCPYCGSNYALKETRHDGVVTNRFLACTSNMSIKACESDNYPYDEFVKILIKQLKALKKDTTTLKSILIDGFKDNSSSDRDKQINILDKKIEEHRAKLKEIDGLMDDFYIKAKNNLMGIISDLTKKKIQLANAKLTAENVDSRIKKIIKALNSLPDDFDSINDINFKEIFSKAVIVNKTTIYFIIGNGDYKDYPRNPRLLYKSVHEYKVRKTVISTKFGIIINK